MNVFLVLFVF